MDRRQGEVEKLLLDYEKQCIADLRKTYTEALADVKVKLRSLLGRDPTLSVVYQIEFQRTLEAQLQSAVDVLKSGSITSVTDFLNKTYEDGYLGTIYSIQGRGIPINIGVDHKQAARVINRKTDTFKFSDRLYENVDELAVAFKSEMTRGIANDSGYSMIARQLSLVSEASYKRALTIVRTEGGRVKSEAKLDSMKAAKDEGADIVKQWDATFDGKTRPEHRYLDGQIREIDEPFTDSQGRQAQAPHKFGVASMDINCRCIVVERARWAVEGEEMPNKVDNLTGDLVEADNYKEWKEKAQKQLNEKKEKQFNKRKEELEKSGVKVFDKNTKNVPKKGDYFQTASKELVEIAEISDYNGIKTATLADGQNIVLKNAKAEAPQGLGNTPPTGSGKAIAGSGKTSNNTIKFNDGLKKSFSNQNITEMTEMLKNAPEDVRAVWDKYEGKLKVINNAETGTQHYSPKDRGVSINASNAHITSEIAGKTPYSSVFHEFGHNIDALASEPYAQYSFQKGQTRIADVFQSQKHIKTILTPTGSASTGYTLTEMLEREIFDWRQTVRRELVIATKGRVRDFEVWVEIADRAQKIEWQNRLTISDIISGTSKGVVSAGFGHSKKYWQDNTVGSEAFAEMFSASICNPEQYKVTKQYFPKSCEIFEEIIKSIGSK